MDKRLVPMSIQAINNKGLLVVDLQFNANMEGLKKTIDDIQFIHPDIVRVTVDIALYPKEQ